MSDFREPLREALHQPPNPADLRRAPPSTPACAKVRGWLRDFADNDLDPAGAKQVEEHVHRCRMCAVELARAEHEVLRVRSALTRGALLPALPEGFAARVVDRLVLDETSMVSGESLKRAAEELAADGVRGRQAAGRKQSAYLHPAVLLFGAMLMLWGLAFGVETFGVRSAVPVPVPALVPWARLVVVDANDTFGPNGRLGRGSGLRDNQSLYVGHGGLADVEWHDAQAGKTQPAARIQVHEDGEIGLENGRPRIYGRVDIETSRPVTLPMADGSQLDLGVGEYSVTATLNEDPLAATPKDLLVEVQVKRGEAVINRSGVAKAATVVGGMMGIYQGRSETNVMPSPSGVAMAPRSVGGGRTEVPAAAPTSYLIGYVRDYTGAAVPDSYAGFAYSVSGAVRNTGQYAGVDGRLQLELPGRVDNGFAVVNVVAAPWRSDLGVLVPDAMRLQTQGPNEMLATQLVFGASASFAGAVRDEQGNPLQGVRVVPCVVDELFGRVWPLPGAAFTSNASGAFSCAQLPSRLPPHQELCLLLLSDGMAPTTVAIPERGSEFAFVDFPPITMRRVQFVGLHNLLPNAPIEVLEEIPGLPAGAGIVRRSATSDSTGAVAALAVGWGPLWVCENAGTTVKGLAVDQYTGTPQLRPNGTSFAWRDQFQMLKTIAGTTVQIANSHRFDEFVSGRSEAGWVSVGPFINSVGYPMVAQVFSVEAFGERCRNVRFLGFTAANGMLSLPVGESEHNLVAMTPDGSCAMALRGPASAATTTINVVPTGRAVLDVSLRPAVGGPEVVPIRFVRSDSTVPGLAPEAIRFAGPSTGWEVRDLLPGAYEVYVGSSHVPVTVPPTGWAVIH